MKLNKKMHLYGAGGHSRVVAEILQANNIEIASVFDDNQLKADSDTTSVRNLLQSPPALEYPLIVTVGNNLRRAEIVKLFGSVEYGIGIHPSATISPSASIGEGTVVLQGSIVQANATIGKHVLINTAASVDHHTVIDDYVHISPHATVCGHVEIGEGTHVGAGTTVIQCIKIGKWCSIGAGSVVINDIPDYCTAIGVPAKIIKQSKPEFELHPQTMDLFDIAFVGSGLASTMTLLQLVDEFKKNPPDKRLRIALLEKSTDFFGGVAYGQRAGSKSLIITNLEEFLPEPERTEFKRWLTDNKGWIFDQFLDQAGPPTKNWWKQNSAAIRRDDWDNLYLPRYAFGEFLAALGKLALQQATDLGIAEFRLMTTTVEDIARFDGPFELSLLDASNQGARIQARRVVLAIGSPPFTRKFAENVYSSKLGGLLVNDPYTKNVSELTKQFADHIETKRFSKINVLLIGANASMIETMYNLCDDVRVRNALSKVLVLSPNLEFPCRISPDAAPTVFESNHLNQLQTTPAFTAEQIFLAAKADIFSARESGASFVDSFNFISASVNELVKLLSQREKQQFVDRYGMEIGRYQRRAGREYSDIVDQLKSEGKLELIQGRFEDVVLHSNDGFKFSYQDSEGTTRCCNDSIQVAVNCTGFEKVSPESSSKLIANLLNTGLAVANPSEMGFKVDETLAVSPDLYVVGPLIAGNIIGQTLVWHAEHCGRIIQFSKCLATHLARQVICERTTANADPTKSTGHSRAKAH